ncbi:MATE family efflux transporter [Trichloromonas sp.]|uniref:MATE family efflux transporter n=1 Tax=Trichloromonas sp. TaxID=3069249 RepID=UPI003D812904
MRNNRPARESRPPLPGGLREMLAIALPMVVSHASETAMIFVDRLFLSRLGTVPMSASMAGGLASFMMMTFFIGLIGYATALVAQYLGAGRKEICARVVTQTLFVALLAYPLILSGRPLVHRLFAVSGIAPAQLIQQQAYFDILLYGAVLVLLRTCLSSFFSGIGRTRVVMLSALVAMLVNIAANYVLIFGRFGLPALGIRGAAIGTLLGSFCALLVLLAAYLGRGTRREFEVVSALRFDGAVMKKLLRFGSPAGVEMFLNLLAFTLMILLFHSHGPATATAVTIVFNWDMVSFVPLIGIQIGVVSLVGRYLGAGRPEVAERAARSGLKMGWAYSSVILILFVFLPGPLVTIFAPAAPDAVYAQAAPLATVMLRLAAFYVLADAVMLVCSGVLRGAGDTFWAMCISVAMHWLLLPVLYLALKVLRLPPQTAWLVQIFLFLAFSVIFYLRYRSGRWKFLQVVGEG